MYSIPEYTKTVRESVTRISVKKANLLIGFNFFFSFKLRLRVPTLLVIPEGPQKPSSPPARPVHLTRTLAAGSPWPARPATHTLPPEPLLLAGRVGSRRPRTSPATRPEPAALTSSRPHGRSGHRASAGAAAGHAHGTSWRSEDRPRGMWRGAVSGSPGSVGTRPGEAPHGLHEDTRVWDNGPAAWSGRFSGRCPPSFLDRRVPSPGLQRPLWFRVALGSRTPVWTGDKCGLRGQETAGLAQGCPSGPVNSWARAPPPGTTRPGTTVTKREAGSRWTKAAALPAPLVPLSRRRGRASPAARPVSMSVEGPLRPSLGHSVHRGRIAVTAERSPRTEAWPPRGVRPRPTGTSAETLVPPVPASGHSRPRLDSVSPSTTFKLGQGRDFTVSDKIRNIVRVRSRTGWPEAAPHPPVLQCPRGSCFQGRDGTEPAEASPETVRSGRAGTQGPCLLSRHRRWQWLPVLASAPPSQRQPVPTSPWNLWAWEGTTFV